MGIRSPLASYWRVVDLSREDPGPWSFTWAQRTIRTATARAMPPLTVSLECGAAESSFPVPARGATELRGRGRDVSIGGRLVAASSVLLRPPWEVRGPFPAWLAAARRVLDGQLRATGHDPEWHRRPDGRGVVVTSFREGLRGIRAIAAVHRCLEAAHLGDEA